MGLNMNYSLLMEGTNERFQIPEYKTVGGEFDPYTRSYILNKINEFNQICNDARRLIIETSFNYDEYEFVNESGFFDTIKMAAKMAFRKVIEALKNIWKFIVKFIDDTVKAMSDKIVDIKDNVEKKYKYHERITMLSKALGVRDDEGKTVIITDIHPTQEMLNKDFPNVKVIGGTLAPMVSDAVNNCIDNVFTFKTNRDASSLLPEETAMQSLYNNIESKKAEILTDVFGKYEFDPTDMMSSAANIAHQAFGSQEAVPTTLTVDLYGQACENLEDRKEILKGISDLRKYVDDNYSLMLKGLNRAATAVEAAGNRKQPAFDATKDYHDESSKIMGIINKILNIVQNAVNANYRLITMKELRAKQIYLTDALKVKNRCHEILSSYLGIVSESTVINGNASDNSIDDFCESFELETAMMEETLLEYEFNDNIFTYITEAEKPVAQSTNGTAGSGTTEQPSVQAPDVKQDQPASDKQDTQPQQNQQAQQTQKSSKIKQWLDNIFAKLGQLLQSFKNRVTEIMTSQFDKKFWAENKEKVMGLITNQNILKDSTLDNWTKYVPSRLKASTVVKFDEAKAANALESDDAMHNFMFKKIAGTVPQFKNQEDTFSHKLTQCFSDGYIEKDKGVKWDQAIGTDNLKDMFEFCDGFLTMGFRSEALGNVDKDFEEIKKDKDATIANYNNKAQEAKPQEQVTKEEKTEANASFNLADALGLTDNHKYVPVMEELNVDPNSEAGADSNGNSAFDAQIKRCYMTNNVAISAKMTAICKAYNQFMNFYAAALGVKRNVVSKKKTLNQAQPQKPTEGESGNGTEENKAEGN